MYGRAHGAQYSTWGMVDRPGADVLDTPVLEYIFEVLVLVEIVGHILVLVLMLNVVRIDEYI